MRKNIVIFCSLFYNILFIHGQEDTTKTILESFLLINNYSKISKQKIDTGLNNLHINNPIYQNGISFSFVGNLASPYINDVFYKRDLVSNYYLMSPYRYYYPEPDEVVYYSTNKPFTNIGFLGNFGSKEVSEHNVSVLHTQNFGPLNAGFKIHHLGGNGHYDRQKTSNGNGSFFAHYKTVRYELFTSVNIVNFSIEQNGGILDSLFYESGNGTTALPKLSSAETLIKNRSFQITQKYKLGIKLDTINKNNSSVASFAHTIGYIQNKRSYVDVLEGTNDADYYDTSFYENTFDTSCYKSLYNQIRFEVYESDSNLFSVHGYVGLNMENIQQFSTTSDSAGSFVPKESMQTTNLAAIWNLGQDKKHYYWNVSGSYYFSGYKQFDICFNSNITFKVLDYQLSGYYKFNNVRPDFFMNKYRSNHFRWDNDFSKMQVNDLGGVFLSERHGLKVQVNNRLASNFVYFNGEALPSQASKLANVLSIEAEKKQELWKFILKGKGVYQQSSSNNYLSVPKWIFYSSIYFDQVIHFKITGGELAFQIGADLYYKSRFYGYGYNPVYEQFHIQKEKKIGGHPYLAPFLNLKIKRTRFFVKYDHFNQLITKTKDYFSLISYPRNPNNIKFGIYWHFYD